MQKKIYQMFILLIVSFFILGQGISAQESGTRESYGSDWKYLGYSILVPGLGQFKKDRPVYGSIALGGFVLLTAHLALSADAFYAAEKNYQMKSVTAAAFTGALTQSGSISSSQAMLMNIRMSSMAFAPYNAAKENANNAVIVLGIFYIAQAFNAFFLNPGGSTAENPLEKSFLYGLDLKVSPERTAFSTGTNYQMSYGWRF
ncbi:MAG TPA: hypothetical protein PL048_10080 [Leptospiraceae bacterium]|nr:hypothetical protein [Leptospiraceae bacterium]HMZ59114.1 hypothetical protein [Leptospiraceae bacterium]